MSNIKKITESNVCLYSFIITIGMLVLLFSNSDINISILVYCIIIGVPYFILSEKLYEKRLLHKLLLLSIHVLFIGIYFILGEISDISEVTFGVLTFFLGSNFIIKFNIML